MYKVSRFASILLTALQLPLFSSAVTYGRTKKLIGNAGRLVSPKKDKDNIKNKKGNGTKGKGRHKIGLMSHSKVRDKVKSVVTGVVDDFFDKPIESSLKYLGIPAGVSFLAYQAFFIIKHEIYNCGHFPSRMKPELIIYLIENNFQRLPSKEELDEYRRTHFSDKVYSGNIDWDTKEKMINYLAGILTTNYHLGGNWDIYRQIGYTIMDVLLFRNARERVNISAKRFLNNMAGSCFEAACYLLLFMESLGVKARLAFCTFPGDCKDLHTCLLYRDEKSGKWCKLDPVLRLYKRVDKCEKNSNSGEHLLVLEEIKRDDKRKIREMKCVKIGKDEVIDDAALGASYDCDVPPGFRW